MNRWVLIASVAFILVPISICDSSSSQTIVSDGPFSISLTNSEGEDLTDPIFGQTTFHFDTFNDVDKTQFIMKAMITVEIIPTFVVVTADNGAFHIRISITGLDSSFLGESGLFAVLESDGGDSTALLESNNGYSHFFEDNIGTPSSFFPNHQYRLSLFTAQSVSVPVAPEDIDNIAITFEVTVASWYHLVCFISEDEIIESQILPDNSIIESVPDIERSGYVLDGWFTPDGVQIVPGYQIDADCGDIIAYAHWDVVSGDSFPILLVAAVVGSSLFALLLLLLILKKRKDDETS